MKKKLQASMIVTLLMLSALISANADTTKPNTNASIRITGDVKKPGDYPFHVGETLTHAIELAGGFTSEFTSSRVRLFRYAGGFDDSKLPYKVWRRKDTDESGCDALIDTSGPRTTNTLDCIGVDVYPIRKKKVSDVPLKEGDWIAVRREVD